MKNTNILLLMIGIFIIVMVCMINKKEKFCSVAPKFDHYYRVHQGLYVDDRANDHPLYKDSDQYYYTDKKDNGTKDDGTKDGNAQEYNNKKDDDEKEHAYEAPKYASDAPGYSDITYAGKYNGDTCGRYSNHHGCTSCGGDYCSVSNKRDRYYQLFQGYLGDHILSGYPYYKAY